MSKPRRIDDFARIAETPAFLLVASSYRYRGTAIDSGSGLTLYAAHEYADREKLMLPLIAPLSLSSLAPRGASLPMLPPLELEAQTFARKVRLEPRERRAEARKRGRRRSMSVPFESMWQVRLFAERDTRASTLESVAEQHGALVARAWRRGNAADWARRALALRLRKERKATS